MAPLAVGLALSMCGPLHFIALIANEADHVVQVEAVAHRAAIDGTSWMAAADRWRQEGERVINECAITSVLGWGGFIELCRTGS